MNRTPKVPDSLPADPDLGADEYALGDAFGDELRRAVNRYRGAGLGSYALLGGLFVRLMAEWQAFYGEQPDPGEGEEWKA